MSRVNASLAFFLGAILGLSPPAAGDQDRPPDPYLANPYQDAPQEWNDPWRDEALGPRNDLSTIDGHVGSGIRVNIPAGHHFGAAMRWRFHDNGLEDPDELWFRYYLRFPEGFVNTGKGKLPGPAGLYSSSARGNRPSTAAEPGWSARMLFSPTYDERDGDHTRIGYYVYHLDQAKDHGDLLPWAEPAGVLAHGRWYCIEGSVRMNTPGERDGVLVGWVDGAEAFRDEGLALRRATEPWVAVDSFWFDVYFGGKETTPQRLAIDFDSLVFGPERIECDDSDERGWNGGFFDDDGSIHEPDIEKLLSAGLIEACNANGDAFCPTEPITRGQMAGMLSTALRLPANEKDHFTDDEGSPYEPAIDAIASLGVTHGCRPGEFCPDRAMNRGEVAAFISRALALPPAVTDYFADDEGSPFEPEINALADWGITVGCGQGTFCPGTVLSRDQAASMLVRAMGTSNELLAIPDDETPEPAPPVKATPAPVRTFGPRLL